VSKVELESRRRGCFARKLKMENEASIKITIWNEGRHEKLDPNVAAIYPSGNHGAISCCIPGTIRSFSVG
jgi:hypothetical protein